MESRVNHTHSPRHTDDPPPHKAPGNPRRRGPASDARRIAELEAEVELRGKMAALEAVVGVDLLDSAEVRALRAAQHRNGGSGFGLLHVQHESGHRVSEAVLAAVRAETERLAKTALEPISSTVLARWAMPHGVVPSLVAEHVVTPFVEPDWVVTGPDAPGTAVLDNVRAAALKIQQRADMACHTPNGQCLLMKLASMAASPADAVALCKLMPSYTSARCKVPWSAEFFAKFFCRLAPRATTMNAVEALCDACVGSPPGCDDAVDFDSVQRFFVALVPGITTVSTNVTTAVMILSHARYQFAPHHRYHGRFRGVFYRGFVVPLARRASSWEMVSFVSHIFSETFSPFWDVTEDLPEILERFSRIATTEGRAGSLPSMIECVADTWRTVHLVSVDAVVLPLVPVVRSKTEAGHLLRALEAIVEHRRRNRDASRQKELVQAMQDLRVRT